MLGCLLFLALLLGAGLWIGCEAISVSVHAEYTYHAANLVTVVLNKYVEREGRWPRSWEDLRTVNSVSRWGMYSWPEDWEKVREYVIVDFDLDAATVAGQAVEEFNGVKPIGAYYPFKDLGYTAELIETARRKAPGQPEHVR